MKSSIAPPIDAFRYALALVLVVLGLAATPLSAYAQTRSDQANARPARAQALEIARVRGMIERQRPLDAIAASEDALKRFPKNTQLRFLYGVALTDAQRTDDAVTAFEALIRDHPELAEPYNNLAVVHASQGRLGAARDALERAVQAVPDYGLAYENLGDLYVRLAQEAYERATTGDKASTAAKRKLGLVRTLSQTLNP